MRANDFLTEQPVTTTNAQGVTTTVDKKAGTVTTSDDRGTIVRDRSGNMRSIKTPRIGGLQFKQTFRPDATPGYGQANYKSGSMELDAKGSKETGFTTSAAANIAGMGIKNTQRYDGQKQMDINYNLGKGTKLSARSTVSKPGAKPTGQMSITKGGKTTTVTNDINEAFEQAIFEDEVTLEDTQDFHEEYGYLGYSIDENDLFEAEYQGRKVKLNKPMRGDVKKFKVYVKNKKGNVIKVNFGHGGTSAKRKTMRIRKSNPKARKSFRARHNCDNPGPKTKARYWSCRKW